MGTALSEPTVISHPQLPSSGQISPRRRRWPVAAAIVVVALLGSGIWLAQKNATHDAEVDRIVNGVAAFNDQLDYGDLIDPQTDLIQVLSLDGQAPILVEQYDANFLAKYAVISSSNTTCVFSVVMPDGYAVQASPEPCNSPFVPEGIFSNLNDG